MAVLDVLKSVGQVDPGATGIASLLRHFMFLKELAGKLWFISSLIFSELRANRIFWNALSSFFFFNV